MGTDLLKTCSPTCLKKIIKDLSQVEDMTKYSYFPQIEEWIEKNCLKC